MKKFKLKKGDQIIVIAGRDKGKTGSIMRVFPREDKIIVSDVNLLTKHKKPSQTDAGGIVKIPAPIHISNVAFYDKKSSKPSRIGYIFDNGKKQRMMKTSKEIIR